jgi:dihydrofolate reductase
MAALTYVTIMSLDGYVADEQGTFDWGAPDEEVHGFINDLIRPVGTYLYGRRMYEVMAVWETMDLAEEPPSIREFAAIWRAAAKVVYSTTLDDIPTAHTHIERAFDPDGLRRMKASAERDLSIGGPEIAAQALAAGLVDECHLFLAPAVVGRGTRALPDMHLGLELLDERRFANGMVYLRYRVTGTE